jgi:hypothetical protein
LEEYLQEIEEKKVMAKEEEVFEESGLLSDAELERVASVQYLPGLNDSPLSPDTVYATDESRWNTARESALDTDRSALETEDSVPRDEASETTTTTTSENPQEAIVNAYATDYSGDVVVEEKKQENLEEIRNAYVMADENREVQEKEAEKKEEVPVVVEKSEPQEIKVKLMVSSVPDEPEVEEPPKPEPIAKKYNFRTDQILN